MYPTIAATEHLAILPTEVTLRILSETNCVRAMTLTNNHLASSLQDTVIATLVSRVRCMAIGGDVEALLEASARIGDARLVTHFIVNGARNLNSSMVAAALNNHTSLFPLFIEHGANTDAVLDKFLFELECWHYHIQSLPIVTALVAHGADAANCRCLRRACFVSDELVDYFVSAGADCNEGIMEILRYYYDDIGGIEDVVLANIDAENIIPALDRLVRRGNTDLNTALIHAAAIGNTAIVDYFIRQGATAILEAFDSAIAAHELWHDDISLEMMDFLAAVIRE